MSAIRAYFAALAPVEAVALGAAVAVVVVIAGEVRWGWLFGRATRRWQR